MKVRFTFQYILLLVIFLLSACSTAENTGAKRALAALNTHYNVYFNGKTSYDEGIRKINESLKEDYSGVLPMFPVSNHESAKSAESSMNRSIEKCRKAIKTHSIKKKPKSNPKKTKNQAYKDWYNQEEFNPALKEVWMLLAKSEFHKADFLGAIGTFTYITRHYATDNELNTACKLWMIRSYAEMNWMYEAEQLLMALDVSGLKGDNLSLYLATQADLLLKKKQYKEAIPFLVKALSKENDSFLKNRFKFVLAQLYKINGDKALSYNLYTEVIKSNPPYVREFNARLQRAELYQTNIKSIRREIVKMTKNPNNKEYLDQLFYVLANTYMQTKDTAKAIAYLNESVEKSTRNGLDKAVSLVKLADLQYERKKYVKALPAYTEASKILTVENDDYPRISKRAETLAELVLHYEICELQDSLQKLGKLPEEKRLAVVMDVIKRMEEEEKKAAEEAKEKAEKAQNNDMNGPIDNFEVGRPAGNNSGWYFYNPNLMRTGQSEFLKKWGKRKLEDHWRRASKSALMFAGVDASESITDSTGVNIADSTAVANNQTAEAVNDKKNPQYHMRLIPVSKEQIAVSNQEWAKALYQMAVVYKEKVEDFPLAIQSFDLYLQKFGDLEQAPDACFQNYMLYYRLNQETKAEVYRNKLIADYPTTKYAELLKQPDYINRSQRMLVEQDSLYDLTYRAYNANAFKAVQQQVDYVKQNYPMSPLLPKFLFLKALSIGKTDKQAKFETELETLVAEFPTSDVSAMAKDILALMQQGRKSRKGTSGGTLLAKRDEELQDEQVEKLSFSKDKTGKHRLMLVAPAKSVEMNQLMYQVAVFNFSRFMVKDFDLNINPIDSSYVALSVTNLQSEEEAVNYSQLLTRDQTVGGLISTMDAKPLVISEINFDLLKTGFGMNDYLAFKAEKSSAKKEIVKKSDVKTSKKTDEKAEVKAKENSVAPKAVKKNDEKDLLKEIDKISISADELPINKDASAVRAPNASPGSGKPVLYRNLFLYEENAPHKMAIYVQSGRFDINSIRKSIEQFNATNYPVLNLKVTIETRGRVQLIYVQSFPDALITSSYLSRVMSEKVFTDLLGRVNYRLLPGTDKNFKTMLERNALGVYTEFVREYYFK